MSTSSLGLLGLSCPRIFEAKLALGARRSTLGARPSALDARPSALDTRPGRRVGRMEEPGFLTGDSALGYKRAGEDWLTLHPGLTGRTRRAQPSQKCQPTSRTQPDVPIGM